MATKLPVVVYTKKLVAATELFYLFYLVSAITLMSGKDETPSCRNSLIWSLID